MMKFEVRILESRIVFHGDSPLENYEAIDPNQASFLLGHDLMEALGEETKVYNLSVADQENQTLYEKEKSYKPYDSNTHSLRRDSREETQNRIENLSFEQNYQIQSMSSNRFFTPLPNFEEEIVSYQNSQENIYLNWMLGQEPNLPWTFYSIEQYISIYSYINWAYMPEFNLPWSFYSIEQYISRPYLVQYPVYERGHAYPILQNWFLQNYRSF